MADALRVEVTWDSAKPMEFIVASQTEQATAYSHTTITCKNNSTTILNSTIQASPQVGYGPIVFTVSPLAQAPAFLIYGTMRECEGGLRWYTDIAVVRVKMFENGSTTPFSDRSILVTGNNFGDPDRYGGNGNGWKIFAVYTSDKWAYFEVGEGYSPPDWGRMLIARHRSDDAGYFSPLQEATQAGDYPRFRITGAAWAKTGPVPDTDVYLRVIDPPDPSDYAVVAGQSRDNDNFDPTIPRGYLEDATGNRLAGSLPTKVRTDQNGRFTVYLLGSKQYSGENYQVEAAFDPTFSCSPNCQRSATITTWKRAYIEESWMARKGGFIAPPPPKGKPLQANQVAIRPGANLCQKCWVRLIHSPKFTAGAGTTDFYSETAYIQTVKNNVVTFSQPLSKSYLPDPDLNLWYLSDAIVVEGSGNNVFSANISYLNQVFPAAYVDYAFAPARDHRYVPWVDTLAPGLGTEDKAVARWDWMSSFGKRWFRDAGRENHQHLIAITQSSDVGYGSSKTGKGLSQSFVYAGKIEGWSLSSGEWQLIGEVAVHELAHLWKVNDHLAMTSGCSAHCGCVNPTGEFRFNSSVFTCTQFAKLDESVTKSQAACYGICPEYRDGTVGFHYKPGATPQTADSEYITIRQSPEPIPQQ